MVKEMNAAAKRQQKCSVCGKTFSFTVAPLPPHFPFCSPRCRYVDLHHWLSGQYAIPGEPASPERLRDAEGSSSGNAGNEAGAGATSNGNTAPPAFSDYEAG